jgi:hypothetical protein
MIKTLLLSHPSAENTINTFSCFVYKGNGTNVEFPGTLKEAVDNLLDTIQDFCSCNRERAKEIACDGPHHNIEEWDDFCEDCNQPSSESNDYVCSFGDWHLFCLPVGTIGAVSGMRHWGHIQVANDNELSVSLA